MKFKVKKIKEKFFKSMRLSATPNPEAHVLPPSKVSQVLVFTPSSSATKCHCRWPCVAAMAFSLSTSSVLHSCLLMLGCSELCQNFRSSSALRPPSNYTHENIAFRGAADAKHRAPGLIVIVCQPVASVAMKTVYLRIGTLSVGESPMESFAASNSQASLDWRLHSGLRHKGQ